ncbi:DUF4181 domain-containing protein [Halobacillus campisalis]|uniref:DUF4181 domain-containing protein n=1 Tax=Halobacillus campisalis TaxID=435909 RepID=A0ABW2K5S3_9BACI|nr:DUF4181 domain-containing protein [Halobacillus campisalis]
MGVAAFIIGLLILIFVTEKVTPRILGFEKKKISGTPAQNIDRWGRVIIFLTFISTQWFVITSNSFILFKLHSMAYLSLLLGFQAVLEFIYIKESKQYINTTFILIMVLILVYNMDYFISQD